MLLRFLLILRFLIKNAHKFCRVQQHHPWAGRHNSVAKLPSKVSTGHFLHVAFVDAFQDRHHQIAFHQVPFARKATTMPVRFALKYKSFLEEKS